MIHDITIRRRVEFSETDMAGLVHFSNYFRYAEAAEAELFRRLQVPLIRTTRLSSEGWPRVRAHCDFSAPLYFDEAFEVHLVIKALKIKAIEYAFRIHKTGAEGARVRVARGGFTSVFARLEKDGGAMTSMTIPDAILDQIEPAPEALWKRGGQKQS